MSEEQLLNLFRAFSQADSSVTRKFGGTGLGLVICKRLIEMMGGTISADSQPGSGSTFAFTVWFGIDHSPAKRLTKPGYRVLVVDDNALARNVLEQLLINNGCAVRTVDSGEAALIELHGATIMPFDCIMIDLNMPDMDGLVLARRIRAEWRQTTKLVMVTGADLHTDDYRDALNDFDQVIEKPVTSAHLTDILMELQGKDDLSIDSPSVATAPLSGLHILVAEDVPTNQLIMRDLLESLGVTVDVADDGAQAIQQLGAAGHKFDLVLMDIQMPIMDGLEATRRIRSGQVCSDIPIIALTAHALDEERQRAIRAGMNDFLTKPIDPDLLLATIQRWRPKTSVPVTSSVAAAKPAPPATFPDIPGIDVDDGLHRMLNRQPLLRRFCATSIHALTVRRHASAKHSPPAILTGRCGALTASRERAAWSAPRNWPFGQQASSRPFEPKPRIWRTALRILTKSWRGCLPGSNGRSAVPRLVNPPHPKTSAGKIAFENQPFFPVDRGSRFRGLCVTRLRRATEICSPVVAEYCRAPQRSARTRWCNCPGPLSAISGVTGSHSVRPAALRR
jgi:CheY-like chemotaxis protein